METLSIYADLVFGIGTLFISIYLLVNENRLRKISAHDLIIKAYDSMNSQGLENDDNLKALAEVLYPDKKDNLELLRQRLFAYIALNAIELTFLSKKYKINKRNVTDPILDDLLKSILHNREAQEIIKTGSYDRKFTERAQIIMNDIEKSNAISPLPPKQGDN